MKQQRGWAGAFGADMTKEDEVAKAALAAAKVTEELLAAEDAAMTAAKEPSKRQKQKQKRKQHKQDQKQTEDTSVPALAISWAEQEAMLAESATLVAQWDDRRNCLGGERFAGRRFRSRVCRRGGRSRRR